MSRLNPVSWQAVSPYLDRALTMEPAERTAFLAALREEHPSVAADLEALLEQHRALGEEHFLEQPPMETPGRAACAGETVGAYRLRAPIGKGGMGDVWLAERSDGRFERQAAVKFLNIAIGRGSEERFKREGNILGRLAHPHIAQLMDAGVSSAGQPYLVLEYINGEPLDHYCDARRLDIESRLRLFLDVLDAVAHAHANLIVHRDLKPSNVLVSADGRVKLLDFGIAKLVEGEAEAGAATALTREAGGAMTLLYAAPEQVAGETVTTATDVYAAGVLLCVLLTGKHPAGPGPYSPAELIRSIADVEPPRLSDLPAAETDASARGCTLEKLRRQLRGDLDTILAKALKKHPSERYLGVAGLAADLRRYLNHQPIEARPDTLSYRAARFVRRNRTPVALAALALVATVAGLVGTGMQARAANRERAIAQRRFNDVRQLANQLFVIDRGVLGLPGNTKVRQLIVDTSLQYLNRIAADARTDPDLALDVGTAYMRVGRVLGVPISSNLGQRENAEKNLRIAEQLIAAALRLQPANHMAHLRAAQIAHDRMVLAEDRHPDTEALPLARQAEAWLEKYLAGGKIDKLERQQVVIIGMNVAYWYGKKDLIHESLRLSGRTRELAEALNLPGQAGAVQINVARALRNVGDLDGALAAIREGVRILETMNDTSYVRTLSLALSTEGDLLGDERGISMGRYREAADYFDRSYQMMLRHARQDAHDAMGHLWAARWGRRLAGVVRNWDVPRSLAVYDEVLALLAGLADKTEVREDEARVLAASTYPLRQSGRQAGARKRLDAAFAKLSALKLYPSEKIEPGSVPSEVLCALAEFEAGAGNLRGGIEIYQELTTKTLAAARPEARLDDATDLSHLYGAYAQLHRRAGQTDAATALDARRLELWRHWERKLPNNPFVLRQLAGQ